VIFADISRSKKEMGGEERKKMTENERGIKN
jgi:hypothetical protein